MEESLKELTMRTDAQINLRQRQGNRDSGARKKWTAVSRSCNH
jgi:hypothetical protein